MTNTSNPQTIEDLMALHWRLETPLGNTMPATMYFRLSPMNNLSDATNIDLQRYADILRQYGIHAHTMGANSAYDGNGGLTDSVCVPVSSTQSPENGMLFCELGKTYGDYKVFSKLKQHLYQNTAEEIYYDDSCQRWEIPSSVIRAHPGVYLYAMMAKQEGAFLGNASLAARTSGSKEPVYVYLPKDPAAANAVTEIMCDIMKQQMRWER